MAAEFQKEAGGSEPAGQDVGEVRPVEQEQDLVGLVEPGQEERAIDVPSVEPGSDVKVEVIHPTADSVDAAQSLDADEDDDKAESTLDDSLESPKSGNRKEKGGFFSFFKRKGGHKPKESDGEGSPKSLKKEPKSPKKEKKKKEKKPRKDKKDKTPEPDMILTEGNVEEKAADTSAINSERSRESSADIVEVKQEVVTQIKVQHEKTLPPGSDVPQESQDDMSIQVERKEEYISSDAPKSFTLPVRHHTTPPTTTTMAAPLSVQPEPGASTRTSQMLAPINSHDASFDGSNDSGTVMDPTRTPGHFVVVAIDFGTTFSGYAFSFTRDPDSIHMMRKWEGGDPGVINQKTPTCLLLTPDAKFHSFGFNARDFFHDLDPQEAKKWLYFEKFKMVLHYNADLNSDTKLKASNGKEVSALAVFSHALRFFKEHSLQELSDQSSTKILNEDVRWVITVPAIWKAPAKQFMRKAAYDAGIASVEYPDQLLIALEPEAASIYVRRLRMHQLVPEYAEQRPLMTPSKRHSSQPLSPMNMDPAVDNIRAGTRYMIVDCGGGTVDITVHEMESKHGNLTELYKATGGPYGSVGVDIEFEKLLIDIFGIEFIDAFKYKRPAGWVDLMIAFESRKRAASPYKNNALNVSLPFSFIDFYKKYKGSQVEAAIRRYGDKDIRWSSQGMLRLSPEAMRRLFLPTLERIKMAVGDVLNNPNVKDIAYLFMVGGFSESEVLQLELRREFNHLLKIVIPQDVSLTILKGAVLFGLDPTVVNVRRSRMTYGVGVLNRFQRGKHPAERMVSKDGLEWCTDVFDRFVSVDQPVALGDTVLRSYTPAKSGQKSSVINIYCTERPEVMFVTDPAVRKCGTLCLDLTDMQYQQNLPKRREIQTRMIFGDTEIKCTALDVATGKCVRASIDFFN